MAREVLLKKSDKMPAVYFTFKGYRVISLLNCLRKVVEKTVAEELTMVCEAGLKLHKGQMGARKRRCAIDAVAAMLHKVQEI